MAPLPLYALRAAVGCYALKSAYVVRLYAVANFGRVIHEFDPWFNFRAAEYLAAHGSEAFFQWFDHMSWYPLGRPIGTTIYPGMQFVAVWIWKVLAFVGQPMSLNDVCVLIPAWFGVVATFFLGLLTWECSRSVDAGLLAAVIMGVLPAHIMRSVAGGFDNECVAIPALCTTFFLWCRSLRGPGSWPWGVLAGLAYFWMVATWGGYIFVLNLIAAHAGLLTAAGRYSSKLHRAYTLFYAVGTILAIRIPVVGTAPLRSLEQMAPLGVFLWLQAMAFTWMMKKRLRIPSKDFKSFRIVIFVLGGAVVLGVCSVLFRAGYFGPISARIRGLFVRHTRTGNPLVDSVAEHQATSPSAYWHYLHYTVYLSPVGLFMCSFYKASDAKFFAILYCIVAYYFSAKMNRLVLLMAPICSLLSGVATAGAINWALNQLTGASLAELLGEEEVGNHPPKEEFGNHPPKKTAKSGLTKNSTTSQDKKASSVQQGFFDDAFKEAALEFYQPMIDVYQEATGVRKSIAALLCVACFSYGSYFLHYCDRVAEAASQPSIMFKTKLKNGTRVIVDDYREAYWWIRDNTPEDARVMAWWDYGYQIAGIAKRTTIADGNTWNHEHIAMLGRCLTSPESNAWNTIRHLADYVLVWTGGGGDDIAKSPHMARIANSVYPDVCPGDPTCRGFGIDSDGMPTMMMERSLLWKLHGHNQTANVMANPELFREVYSSKYNLVRIYQVMNISEESKTWASNPANWECDAPGSWYCSGQYPPAIREFILKRKNFKQLEDFNSDSDADSVEYQKAYHARMAKRGSQEDS